MQGELLQAIQGIIRNADTHNRYSAWRHGDSEVEVVVHLPKGDEQHLGYVTTVGEAVLMIETVEARHGTDDSD